MNILTLFSALFLLLAPQLAFADDESTTTRTTTITNTVTITVFRSAGSPTTAGNSTTSTPAPNAVVANTTNVFPLTTSNAALGVAPTALPMVMAGGFAVLLGAAL
ncbi:hypothetical protein PAAG_07453 [Paracoccidioides lutzii Pb01]|uniref:Uncharacterized protein n=1 Tax=Paracoccidioides lutzii (strain ATCC MYA-826 / Pb01) TaxID=502779 RepID=C1H9L2_PARBA|nr:hypothetical protein PAAG_07453 [Paracoccidioides lutzii Pb01]EEH37035.1 hypothetical protein PAAG_07453 [Paracoccidioides lutzii Pb01]